MKAPAVDGVYDDGGTGKFCGDAPEDPRLGAVRVDDYVLTLADLTVEFIESLQVIDRADFTKELRQDGEIHAALAHFLDQAAFAAGLRSGDDDDSEAGWVEEGGGVHGVFLRTADDETGDEVEDGDGRHRYKIMG